MSHTPGPWRLIPPEEGHHTPLVQRGTEGGFSVLGVSRDRELADARLIAAAPDLLAALIEAEFIVKSAATKEKITNSLDGTARHAYANIKAAIKKARGE